MIHQDWELKKTQVWGSPNSLRNKFASDNVLTAAAEVEKEIVVLKRCVQHGKIMTYEGLCLHLILRTSYIIQQRLSMPFRSQIRVSASSEIKVEACKGLSTEEVMRVAGARYIEFSSQKYDQKTLTNQ